MSSMSPEERIIALERELDDTRLAAVRLILGIVRAIATTPVGRQEMARGFDEAAAEADPLMARMARLVATELRRE